MSINFRNLGWWKADNDYATRPNKIVLPTSTGTTLIIMPDGNEPEPYAQNNNYGSGSGNDAIYIYEANAAFTTITLVSSMDIGGNWDKPYDRMSADLYQDNSIGIAFQRAGQSIYYRKITYGTWAQGAIESVSTPTGEARSLDVSISEADIAAVSYLDEAAANPKLTLKTIIRNTSNAWTPATAQAIMTTADPNNAMSSVSLQWAKGGSAATRPLAVAITSAQESGSDHGCRIYSMVVNEATGAVINFTLRKTILAGDMSTGWGSFVRRAYLFRSGDAELTAVYMQTGDKKKLTVARYTWDGNTWAETIPPQTTEIARTLVVAGRMAAGYANDRVLAIYISEYSGLQSAINYVASINRADASVRFSGPFKWDNLDNSTQDRWYPMAGTGKWANIATSHAAVYFGVNSNNLWHARGHSVKSAPAPLAVTPATGSPVNTGTPALGLRATLGKQWPQSKHKAQWQLAKDAGFTTSLRDYTQADDKFVTIENTQLAGSYVFIGDSLPQELALTSGTWYLRGRLIDEFGNAGAWSATSNFTLSHLPAATNLTPNSGSILLTGSVTFSWLFTDPLSTDVQTAFQVIVEENDTGTVIYDSGKVSTSAASHLANINAAYYGKLLRWTVRLWDSDDMPGAYSEYQTFLVATAPTVAINTPSQGGTVTSGTPAIFFTPTVGNDRTIKNYRAVITQGGKVVKDSGMVAVSVSTGTQLQWRPTLPLLTNAATYSVQVTVWDQYGMSGTSPVHTFTVNMTLPATPTTLAADAINYNVEGYGYVWVTWSNSNIDADFESWVIERKDDFIGLNNLVVSEGTWEEVGVVTNTTPEYKDYYAPSGYKVNYRVRQVVNRAGDRAISNPSTESTVYPVSEGYWIIEEVADTSGDSVAFRLANVTSDSFTDEYEENEYIVIGKGRHVDRGDHLGPKGNMTAQLRDSNASTARQKRLQLQAARGSDSALFIRNPFGDVWEVNIGNLGISRIAGVGKSEFVDVDIPYSKVGAEEE
jgi:hypothetical protein